VRAYRGGMGTPADPQEFLAPIPFFLHTAPGLDPHADFSGEGAHVNHSFIHSPMGLLSICVAE
jgi:hypothetical protein